MDKSDKSQRENKQKKIAQKDVIAGFLKTPQELIHIKHVISLNQYLLWLLLLKECHHQFTNGQLTENTRWIYIPTSDLCDLLKYRPSTVDIKSDLENLRKTPITYNILRKNGNSIQFGAGFISQWSLSTYGKIGVVLPDFIQECVLNLEMRSAIFQTINMIIFSSFGNKYDAILYKLCRDYVGIGRTPPMSIEEYRTYMGIAPEDYQEFRRLNNRIIKAPAAGVNESSISDISVEPKYEKDRTNRKVERIYFTVQRKESTINVEHSPFGEAINFITPLQQNIFLQNFTVEEIKNSVSRATQYIEEAKSKSPVRNPGAVYNKAISGNWGRDLCSDPVDPPVQTKEPDIRTTKATGPVHASQDQAFQELRKSRMSTYRRHLQTLMIKAMPKVQQKEFLENYAKTKGIDSAQMSCDPLTGLPADKVQAMKYELWLRAQPDMEPTIEEQAFDEWLQSSQPQNLRR